MKSKITGVLAAFVLFMGFNFVASSSEAAALKGGLKEIQKQVGEYFSAAEYPENFQVIEDETQVSAAVMKAAQQYISDYIADGQDQPEFMGAEVGAYNKVVDENGVQVGYLIEVFDQIDHPLWEGSGVNLWFDLDGNLVADVSWSM